MEANENTPKMLRHVSDIFAKILNQTNEDPHGFFFFYIYLYIIMYMLSLSCEMSPLSLSFIFWFVSL